MGRAIGITLGDPAGIGPEITAKALKRIGISRAVLIGPQTVWEQVAKDVGLNVPKITVIDTGSPGKFVYGKAQKNCGATAYQALRIGVQLLKTGEISALVTAPVAKAALRLAGFPYPGQTEFLAHNLGKTDYAMLAWSPTFRVIFVTIHLPLARVSAAITTKAVLKKIRLLWDFLLQEGFKNPLVGVFAFNPHGEEFSLGEEARIRRAVKRAQAMDINVKGPFPADAIFAQLQQCHGFVAMYHDQAMIPAKLLARGKGVNVSLGLGRIRTSPLHGVAFDIAGKGVADPSSMIAALQLARKLAMRQQ